MAHAIDLTNKKFGRLRVIERATNDNHGTARWLCECECGTKKIIRTDKLREGEILSCGCYRRERGKKLYTKHNLTFTKYGKKLLHIYSSMKYRCNNPKFKGFKYYGGRGIKVCKEWENSFEAFYKWAIDTGFREELSIDRIDVNKGYSPENCRWATSLIQQRNKTSNRIIKYNGVSHCISEWAEITGINYCTITGRLNRGWNIEKTLTTPSRRHKHETI